MWNLKSIGLCLQRRRCLKMLTDGRRSHWYTNSSPQNFGSGELKSCQDLEAPPTLQNCLDPHIDLMRIRVPFFQSFFVTFECYHFQTNTVILHRLHLYQSHTTFYLYTARRPHGHYMYGCTDYTPVFLCAVKNLNLDHYLLIFLRPVWFWKIVVGRQRSGINTIKYHT